MTVIGGVIGNEVSSGSRAAEVDGYESLPKPAGVMAWLDGVEYAVEFGLEFGLVFIAIMSAIVSNRSGPTRPSSSIEKVTALRKPGWDSYPLVLPSLRRMITPTS